MMLREYFVSSPLIHNRLQEARRKYYDVTKYLPPETNIGELEEYKELQEALFSHHMQCGCESKPPW